MKEYYDARAPEYDDWYLGLGCQVYKRYFRGAELAAELGGGTVMHESDWFVMVSTKPREG